MLSATLTQLTHTSNNHYCITTILPIAQTAQPYGLTIRFILNSILIMLIALKKLDIHSTSFDVNNV
jgi:hypothetical protein